MEVNTVFTRYDVHDTFANKSALHICDPETMRLAAATF